MNKKYISPVKHFVSLDEFKQGIRSASMRKQGIDTCPDCGLISEDCECVV